MRMIDMAALQFCPELDAGIRRGAFLWKGQAIAFGHDGEVAGDRFAAYLELIRTSLASCGYSCEAVVQEDSVWAMPITRAATQSKELATIGAIVTECWRVSLADMIE